MMLDVRKEAKTRFLIKGRWASFTVVLVLAAEMVFLLTRSATLSAISSPENSVIPTIENLSLTLFSDYLLPFEVASVILLVALIGAVVLARTEKSTNFGEKLLSEDAK